MATSLISLGANLDRPETMMAEAAQRLLRLSATGTVRFSRVYETVPVGGPPGQGPFLNAAALIETQYPATELLDALHQFENELGRTREVRWAPRSIDLDLLLYDNLICHSSNLTLPHPRMTFRRFVLEPSCELAPEMMHPTAGVCLSKLLEKLNTNYPFAVIMGSDEAVRIAMMEAIQNRLLQHKIEVGIVPRKNREAVEAFVLNYFLQKQPEGLQPNKAKNQAVGLKRWLLSDIGSDPSHLIGGTGASRCAPKLLISLDGSLPAAAGGEFMGKRTVSFPGSLLQIAPDCSQKMAVDEAVAAILAISLLPIPLDSLSLAAAAED